MLGGRRVSWERMADKSLVLSLSILLFLYIYVHDKRKKLICQVYRERLLNNSHLPVILSLAKDLAKRKKDAAYA